MVRRPGSGRPVLTRQLIRAALLGLAALLVLPAHAQDTGDDPAPVAPSDAPAVLGQIEAQMPMADEADGPMSAQMEAASGILVLNQERYLARSLYGQRIQRELEAASLALNAENREIEAQLTAEELELTDQRQTMEPDAFRLLAQDFDQRVEAIRAAQEAKGRAIQSQAEAAQARFFELSVPVLLQIVQDRDASVLLDSRTVLLVAETVDITDIAIAAVDAALGEGGDAPLVEVDGTRGPVQRTAP